MGGYSYTPVLGTSRGRRMRRETPGTSKAKLASDTRKRSVECVSAPLYVCWRDKKASLPNFPRTRASRRPSGLVGCAAFTPRHSPCPSLPFSFSFSLCSLKGRSRTSTRVENNFENLSRRRSRICTGRNFAEKEKERGDTTRKLSLKLKLEISESCQIEGNKQNSREESRNETK